jgi:2-polyprenyl-3-methyl-5-hydroxy-6-metoxy-1,4-benzoquinol methylase
MPLFLRRRATELREQMDDPACDPAKLQATYRHFDAINQWFSGWETVYKRYLRPRMEPGRAYSLLDIGFGGGDIPQRLLAWAARDGLTLRVTAIDPDVRAAAYARSLPATENLRFQQTDTRALAEEDAHFDFVVSNHLLHHLPERELRELLRDSERLGRVVIHNDIARADTAYLGFALLTAPFYRGSFITPDGLASIRRAYTPNELRAAVPDGWHVERPLRYRLLLTRGL